MMKNPGIRYGIHGIGYGIHRVKYYEAIKYYIYRVLITDKIMA